MKKSRIMTVAMVGCAVAAMAAAASTSKQQDNLLDELAIN